MTEEITKILPLKASRFKETVAVSNFWTIIPDEATKFEDLLVPEYWAHVAARLRTSDIISVVAEDGSYYAQLYVAVAGSKYAKVVPLFKADLESAIEETPALVTHVVKFKGPILKHCVIRLSDKEIISQGHSAKQDAENWLRDHFKALAA